MARIVISLLFNLTANNAETSCTGGQTRAATTISSVQPSELQIESELVVCVY